MKQSLLHQIGRYGLVGLIVYACDYLVFSGIVWAAPHAHLAGNLLGKAAGAAVGFVLHKKFTFSWEQAGNTSSQAIGYAGLFLFNLASSSLLLWLAVDKAGINPFIAKLAIDAVVIATAFVVSRTLIYRPAQGSRS